MWLIILTCKTGIEMNLRIVVLVSVSGDIRYSGSEEYCEFSSIHESENAYRCKYLTGDWDTHKYDL